METAIKWWHGPRAMTESPATPARPIAAVILAAGKGTRMKSSRHKVLHAIAGRPMIEHLLASLAELAPERTVVVVGDGRDQLEQQLAGRVELVVQEPQLGTGHAVQQAEVALKGFEGDVLVLYADVPFVRAATMRAMIERLHVAGDPADVAVLGFEPADTLEYGRVIANGGRISWMVEHKDASEDERRCRLCNSGLMAAPAKVLFGLLTQVGNDNAQGEYYLPDIVNVAIKQGGHAAVITTDDPDEVAGINSRAELASAEARWQHARRLRAMADGATLVAPETVFFAWDTALGRDVTIEPNVVFGPGAAVADGATIHAFSHIEGAEIGEGVSVGPFARLRPGAKLGNGSKVGNFVEVKNTELGEGAKANHLTYLGDATVGAGANIGAGTITCNYDGYFKHRTIIGERAFIGSNSALIAPVTIGADAIVAAGSAVSRDVAPGELRMVRAEQLVKPGWADRFRDTMTKKKAEARKSQDGG
jgi:bifunctional UDP-N-acetylglucosamine pyrophosphorylase/glucosamine-1-phosphate N-acetyltransferase